MLGDVVPVRRSGRPASVRRWHLPSIWMVRPVALCSMAVCLTICATLPKALTGHGVRCRACWICWPNMIWLLLSSPHMGCGTVARALRGYPESRSRDGLSWPLPRSVYRPDACGTARYHAAFRSGFESRLGIKPVGFRTPSGDWSPHTATILKEFGVLYSSSMRGDDRPYFHPGPDGEPGLVEIRAAGISTITQRLPISKSLIFQPVTTA